MQDGGPGVGPGHGFGGIQAERAGEHRQVPEDTLNPSLTSQLADDRRASLLAEARREHQAAAARRARPSTKMSRSSSNRSSGSASANSSARLVMFGNESAGSEAM